MTYDGELEAHHIGQMTWFRPPGANRSKQLSHTQALEVDFRAWLAGECREHQFAIRKVPFSNGQINYRKQCTVCGAPGGSWISKSKLGDLSIIPEASLDLHEQYQRRRLQEWKVVQERHFHKQNSMDRLAYQSYLKSPEWKAKRAKVLLRAQGVCEGCMERQAIEVHHVTYQHIFDEMLWELRAVCEECHERLHVELTDDLFDGDLSGA